MDEIEREYQDQMLEEKLVSDEMLHDEELAYEKDKETLEQDIFKIRLQLKENRILEIQKRRGENVNPRDEIWIVKATQALLIKKRNLKKINKKLFEIKKLLYKGDKTYEEVD